MINKYLIFITILFFQYLWDRLTTNCITLTGELLLFIHHLIDVYVFLGGILFNPLYHLIFVILVLIHWITNNNRCQVTIVTNKYCGYPYEYKFQDLIQKFKLQNIHENIHYLILFLIIIFDIFNIYKKYVCRI